MVIIALSCLSGIKIPHSNLLVNKGFNGLDSNARLVDHIAHRPLKA
ncbi:hypothetical protein THOD04_60413 [Vibrio owensii]|nr:hypothetical protein THZB04_60007 [Vibrio owensii]CAH1598796.1 hypothetical protein THOD04_60413 [Vibrio owensii]